MGRVRTVDPPVEIAGVALAEVFDRNYADVYRYLARRVPAAVAEDLASEVFVQAAIRAKSFDPERGGLRGWIFGIATHQLSHHYREEERAYRAYARTGVDPVTDAGAETDRAIDRVDSQSHRRYLGVTWGISYSRVTCGPVGGRRVRCREGLPSPRVGPCCSPTGTSAPRSTVDGSCSTRGTRR